MKILLTGFTQRMVNSPRIRYDYVTSVFLLREALTALGHEVDHRAVTVGEDLSSYARALVGVAHVKSFTARHVVDAAYVMERLPGRTVLYCDDWSVEDLDRGIRSSLRRWDAYLKWLSQLRGTVEARDAIRLRRMLERLAVDNSLQLLAPMFPWGQHTLLTAGLPYRLETWDPTTLLAWDEKITTGLRKRQWICGVLQKCDAWLARQSLTWPVQQLGNRRTGAGYIPEPSLRKLYGDSWGVICPAYRTAGSGWWRARYLWSALARCVLYADTRDTAVMGHAYQVWPCQVERQRDEELAALADRQHAWLLASVTPRKEVLVKLESIIAG